MSMSQKIIGVSSLVFLCILWGFTAVHFKDLPPQIPIHFNAAGTADGFATRIHIWGLPLIATALFALFKRLQKRQKIQPVEVQLLQWMQFLITGIFCYIQLQTFLVALNRSEGLGNWFLPVTMIEFILPVVWVIIQQQRA